MCAFRRAQSGGTSAGGRRGSPRLWGKRLLGLSVSRSYAGRYVRAVSVQPTGPRLADKVLDRYRKRFQGRAARAGWAQVRHDVGQLKVDSVNPRTVPDAVSAGEHPA